MIQAAALFGKRSRTTASAAAHGRASRDTEADPPASGPHTSPRWRKIRTRPGRRESAGQLGRQQISFLPPVRGQQSEAFRQHDRRAIRSPRVGGDRAFASEATSCVARLRGGVRRPFTTGADLPARLPSLPLITRQDAPYPHRITLSAEL